MTPATEIARLRAALPEKPKVGDWQHGPWFGSCLIWDGFQWCNAVYRPNIARRDYYDPIRPLAKAQQVTR